MIKYTNKKVINLQDWDDLVEKTYGKPYSFQQQDGCKERQMVSFTVPSDYTMDEEMNDDIPEEVNGEEMGVKFAVWLAKDPKQHNLGDDWRNGLFWDRNFYPDFYTLVNDLHAKGLLKAGKYSIDIDW